MKSAVWLIVFDFLFVRLWRSGLGHMKKISATFSRLFLEQIFLFVLPTKINVIQINQKKIGGGFPHISTPSLSGGFPSSPFGGSPFNIPNPL
jgi:hypothetical protein